MKLNLTQPFRTLTGAVILEKKSEGKPIVLKSIVLDSLLGTCTGDGESGGSEFRERRFAVAVKVTQAEDDAAVELELEEAGVIKQAIKTRHPGLLPLFHGQALALVEGKATGLEN